MAETTHEAAAVGAADTYRSSPQLPTLTEGTYKLWLKSIRAYAVENDLSQHMFTPHPPAPTIEFQKHAARAERIILANIKPSVVIALGDSFLEMNPYQMLQELAKHFLQSSSEEKHDILLGKAETMHIAAGETIDDFFARHRALRLEMQSAAYPLIDSEKTTVKFILAGLRARPSLKSYIAQLRLMKSQTIADLQNNVYVITNETTAQQHGRQNRGGRQDYGSRQDYRPPRQQNWCEWHYAYVAHTHDKCHLNPQNQNRNNRGGRGPRGGRRGRGGRGRGGYHSQGDNPRIANHAWEYQEWPQADAIYEYDYQDTPQYQTSTARSVPSVPPSVSGSVVSSDPGSVNPENFSYYILDSGCSPTLSRSTPPGFPHRRLPILLPDGSQVQAQTTHGTQFMLSKSGCSYRLNEVASFPTLRHNLLSIPQFAKDNNCFVLFGPESAHIMPPGYVPDLSPSVDTAPLKNGFYQMLLKAGLTNVTDSKSNFAKSPTISAPRCGVRHFAAGARTSPDAPPPTSTQPAPAPVVQPTPPAPHHIVLPPLYPSPTPVHEIPPLSPPHVQAPPTIAPAHQTPAVPVAVAPPVQAPPAAPAQAHPTPAVPVAVTAPNARQPPPPAPVRVPELSTATSTRAPAKVRGSATDARTQTIPFPAHLPGIPEKQRADIDTAHSWHLRLNHAAPGTIRTMATTFPALKLPRALRQSSGPMHCAGCSVAHFQRAPHAGTAARPPPGHTLATDVAGPFGSGPFKYFLSVSELHTRMRLVYLLQSRSEVPTVLRESIVNIERHFGTTVSRVRCDNAAEYLPKDLRRWMAARGTALDPTVPHSPQENSVAERLNRTLMSRVRATLASSRLPFEKYWNHCLLDTVAKSNSTLHLPTKQVPLSLWNDLRDDRSPLPCRSLDLTQFRMFGELAHIPVRAAIKSKSAARARLVRYLFTHPSGHYQTIDTSSGLLQSVRPQDYRPYNPRFDPARLHNTIPLQERAIPRINPHYAHPRVAFAASSRNNASSISASTPIRTTLLPTETTPTTDGTAGAPADATSPPAAPTPTTADGVHDPTNVQHHAYATFADAMTDLDVSHYRTPQSLSQARSSPDSEGWRQAYDKEYAVHEKFGTFKYVDADSVPKNALVPHAIFRFVYKFDKDGNIAAHKARFAYPGHRLKAGIHYNPNSLATYAADRDTIRLVLALATEHGLDLNHIDLESAFIQEDYNGDTVLYLSAIPNFDGTPRHPGKVAVIAKNLYGTPDACRIYSDGLHKHLLRHGFKASKADQCLYTKMSEHGLLIIAVTIDDFLTASPNAAGYEEIKRILRTKYVIKDLGKVSKILNWSVHHGRDGSLHIHQPQLVRAFINTMGLSQGKATKSPYASGLQLHPIAPAEAPLPSSYQFPRALGILRYIVDSTRPDLAFVTGALARSMAAPTMRHWRALLHVARYLIGTASHGLMYTPGARGLRAETDADFAGCLLTRKSTYGSLFRYGNCLVSWTSRRIKSNVICTTTAEYIGMSNTALHAEWMRQLLSDMTHKPVQTLPVYSDNTAGIAIANARGPTKRSKYIDVRYHHIRDMVASRIITTHHHPTTTLSADALTKPLPGPTFIRHRDAMALVPLPPSVPVAVEDIIDDSTPDGSST